MKAQGTEAMGQKSEEEEEEEGRGVREGGEIFFI